MKKTWCVRALSLFLTLVMVAGVLVVLPVGTVASAAGATSEDLSNLLNAEAYEVYADRYEEILKAQQGKVMADIPIKLFDFIIEDENGDGTPDLSKGEFDMNAGAFYPDAKTVYTLENLDGSKALFTPDNGSLTWTFTVDQLNLSGTADFGYMYMLVFEYYPIDVANNVATVERSLAIDGRIPFGEARALAFSKSWTYGYENEAGDPVFGYKVVEGGSNIFNDKTPDFYYDKDKGGNDIRYTAMQDPEWMTYYAKDIDGFHHGNFYFYLEPGEHTITLSGSRENLAIKSITLIPAQNDDVRSYADYLASHKDRPDNAKGSGSITILEAEFPTHVSDTSVYPANDRSSAINSPSDPASQLMNTIGAASYNTVGQWASYSFTVSESGWYNLTMRYRQNLLDGLFVSRTVKLAGGEYGYEDGTPKVPFEEAYRTRFNYSKDWQVGAIGAVINNEETPFQFYFEAGTVYTVAFEVSLGDLANIIKRVEDSLSVINNCYLNIIKLTGASPDQYRDYGFNEIMPETITAMLEQAALLDSVAAEFVALAGSKGSQVATLEQIAFLLNKMGSKESEIAKNLSTLKSNIGTLGTWLNTVKQQGLLFDYVSVQPVDAEMPRVNANIFQTAWFEIQAFFVSFFVDYNSMGVKADAEIDPEKSIDVWLAYGRDQSLIWRSLIDTDFTPRYNIPVQLKLVAGGTLLPSVLSGQGPDIYIGLGAADTINYAIRGAVEYVNGLEGYVSTYGYDVELTEKAENSYNRTYYVDPISSTLDANKNGVIDPKEAVSPNTYYPDRAKRYDSNGDGKITEADNLKYEVRPESIVFNYANTIPISLLGKTYGVPETTNFSMLFYRMDVLAELGISVPTTWDDLLEATTRLQSQNMEIGLSYLSAMTTFVYQKGGSQWLYESADEYADPSQYDPHYAGAQIGYGTDIALDAFRFCTRLYTDYSFDVQFDAANRFRTGEMPLVITDYCSLYNTLTVFATEIRGLWSFTRLPGFQQKDADGNLLYEADGETPVVNNCAVASLTATVMLKKGDRNDPKVAERINTAWEYMKWQATDDAQASYGNQMVAIIGPSAKYATANNQALRNLSWTSSELASLLEQFQNLAAVPNYPGSYIISRYVEFAFLAAVNEGADPVDQMSTYVTTINAELTRKRQEFEEFNLKVLKPGETPPGYLPES